MTFSHTPFKGERVVILVTGGSGFIGNGFIERMLEENPLVEIINVDLVTDASGGAEAVRKRDEKLTKKYGRRYKRVEADINAFDDTKTVGDIGSGFTVGHLPYNGKKVKASEFMMLHRVDHVVHLAAETHDPKSWNQEHRKIFQHSIAGGTKRLLNGINDYIEDMIQICKETPEYEGEIERWSKMPEEAGEEFKEAEREKETKRLKRIKREEKDRIDSRERLKQKYTRRLQTMRVVIGSSAKIYGSLEEGASSSKEEDSPMPASPYAEYKTKAERKALLHYELTRSEYAANRETHSYRDAPMDGFPAVILRFENVVGPFQNPEKFVAGTIDRVLAGTDRIVEGEKPFMVFGADVSKSYSSLENACEAILLGLECGKPGGIYNIGANCELSNLEVAQSMGRVFEKLSTEKLSTGDPPIIPKRLDGRAYTDPSLIDIQPEREGDYRRESLNIELAQKPPEEGGLGYNPKNRGREAFEEVLEWVIVEEYRARVANKRRLTEAAIVEARDDWRDTRTAEELREAQLRIAVQEFREESRLGFNARDLAERTKIQHDMEKHLRLAEALSPTHADFEAALQAAEVAFQISGEKSSDPVPSHTKGRKVLTPRGARR